MISAHNLPKTRDERCVPQAWDEFESPCDFAQLPLTTADVASPMCEVCRIVPALECLLWAYATYERARHVRWICPIPRQRSSGLASHYPVIPPVRAACPQVSWLSPQVELLGGRVGPGTQWTVMGGVAPPWEQARQLVITPWESGRSPGHHPLGWGCHLVIAP